MEANKENDHERFSECINYGLVDLTENTKVNVALLNRLEKSRLISSYEAQKILQGVAFERSVKFYEMIKKKGAHVLISVIEALNETDQTDIAKRLISIMSDPRFGLAAYCPQQEETKQEDSSAEVHGENKTEATELGDKATYTGFTVEEAHSDQITQIIQDKIDDPGKWEQVMMSLKINSDVIVDIMEETSFTNRVNKGIKAWIYNTPKGNRKLSKLVEIFELHSLLFLKDELIDQAPNLHYQ